MLAAQQVFCKPKVGSSILSAGTKFFNWLDSHPRPNDIAM